jgi:alpha-1,2-mannosyltransferase
MLPSERGGLHPMIGSTFGLRLLAKPSVQLASLVLLATLVFVFRAVQFASLTTQPQWGYDLSFYWTAGQQLLHGESIYSAAQLAGPYAPQGQDGFLYPPPFAALSILLVWLAPAGARTAEWLWSGLGLVIVIATTLVLVRSERLQERLPLLRGRGQWLMVAAAIAFPPVVGELTIGNVHLLLLGLFALAWIGMRRGDRTGDWMAGIGIGVATVIKLFPGVLLLWLLMTRRYRAAAAAVVSGAVLTLMALPVTGIQPWLQYPTVIANLSAVKDTTDTISPTMWLAPLLSFGVARLLVTGACLALLAWVAWRPSGLAARPARAGEVGTALSFAVAVTISVLIAPNVFHHYLSIFVLPMLLGIGGGIRFRWLVLAYLLMSGGQQPGLGELAWVVNRVLPTAGALALVAGLVLAWRGAAPVTRAAEAMPA